MKIERTKNAVRNIAFGSVLKIYQILLPFVMRTVMIYFMGVQYLGLNSLFTSILQVLNLAELGIGNAMVFSMYKPIAEDDAEKICALMHMYKIYYRIIGLAIAVVGFFCLPIIPYLVKQDLPSGVNVYVLYLLNLSATVFSYWLFAYKNSLLQAYQRIDVVSKVTLATNTVQYLLQIFVLIVLRNYYAYLIVSLVMQIMTNIVTALVTTKMYPSYGAKGKLPKDDIKKINRRIRDLFTSKVGAVVLNSSDTIVISAFLGLTTLAIYQNYYFILTSVIGFVTIIFNACTAGIGNSLIVESKEKNYEDLNKITFIIAWIAGFCSICFLCLFQPFMDIWVGPDMKLEFGIVICLCVYYFVYEINQLLNTFKDAAGMWHEDRWRPLITSITNLGMNLILVNYMGLYGIILSTILSMVVIGSPWLLHNIFTVVFERKNLKQYVSKLGFYLLVTVLTAIMTYCLCTLIKGDMWIVMIGRTLLCIVFTNVMFFFIYRKRREFKESVVLADKIINGKFGMKIKVFFKFEPKKYL